MSNQAERFEFTAIMTREFPHVGTAAVVEAVTELMKLARKHHRLQEKACNEEVAEDHDADCERAIRDRCKQTFPGCFPVFSGDPRGCTVKLKVPSGRANDFGGTGICVPQ